MNKKTRELIRRIKIKRGEKEKSCLYCGKKYWVYQHDYKKSKFCCQNCCHTYRSKNKIEKGGYKVRKLNTKGCWGITLPKIISEKYRYSSMKINANGKIVLSPIKT